MNKEITNEIVNKVNGILLSTSYISVRLFNCLKRAGYTYLR